MATEAENRAAFRIQADYCTAMGAPITAAVASALADALDAASATGRRVLDWPGEPVADAIALRLIGGLHALHRARVDPAIDRVFCGDVHDAGAVLAGVLRAHDAALLPWLDGPPQTNEAARSAGLMTGLLHVAERLGPRMELLEIGSSAGLNLLIDRFRFDLGGVTAGPADATVRIVPEWRGPPPPDVAVAIAAVRGVDIAPVDVRDAVQAKRLAAYVWVDNAERLARLEAGIAMIRGHGVLLEQGDAADWIEARLAEPQPDGVTRVLMHSVVWQYLPDATQARIRAAMERAGAAATPERPLGWVMMEPNRDLHRQEVRVRTWPGIGPGIGPGPGPGTGPGTGTGGEPMALVAYTHAHGAWVEGLAPPYPAISYVMRPYRR